MVWLYYFVFLVFVSVCKEMEVIIDEEVLVKLKVYSGVL